MAKEQTHKIGLSPILPREIKNVVLSPGFAKSIVRQITQLP
jgi:hypothetical protein